MCTGTSGVESIYIKLYFVTIAYLLLCLNISLRILNYEFGVTEVFCIELLYCLIIVFIPRLCCKYTVNFTEFGVTEVYCIELLYCLFIVFIPGLCGKYTINFTEFSVTETLCIELLYRFLYPVSARRFLRSHPNTK